MIPTPIENSVINLYCLKDILGPHGLSCGCPVCCASVGLTAVYCVDDFDPDVEPLGYWPKSVCTEKLALLVRERIVPGWPGGKDDGHRVKGPVFIPK